VFHSLRKGRYLKATPIILLFTKIELFREKLARVPLERYFPEYEGGPNVDKAIAFVTNEFLSDDPLAGPVYPVTANLVKKGGQGAFWKFFETHVFGCPTIPLETAADYFAVAVFLSDKYLRLKKRFRRTGLGRYLAIIAKLPMDLQMILSHRTVGSAGVNIRSSEAEISFRALVSYLLNPPK